MNWDEIAEVLDTEVFNKTQRHLKEVENIVLQGAWQGKTYEQIEATCQYSLSYLKQAAGPKLWKLLSEVLEEDIGKINFRVVLDRRWGREQPRELVNQSHSVTPDRSVSKADWEKAPETTVLYGRDRELKLLHQWIVKDRCRLVTIFGMGGMGKTALAIHCAKQIQTQFDSVIWRSLHYVSGAAELVGELLSCFAKQSDRVNSENLDSKISNLIEYLRRDRYLIVLDTATEIWQSGDLAGHYRQQYKGYGELLRRLATESHQSCLLLCTREQPREIAFLEGENTFVRSLHLDGLTSGAENIFQEKGLLDPHRWDETIELYRANPLALKIVATTIQELFGGSVAAFLQQDTIVYGDIYDLLDEQFERLSSLEQEIVNWFAIAQQPLSLAQLQANILLPMEMAKLIEALESLIRRSLIAKTKVKDAVLFSLDQPVVIQYAINRSIEIICEEITEADDRQDFSQIEFLRNYALVSGNKEIRQRQLNKIIIPLKNKLYRVFRDESAIAACLQVILLSLKDKTPLAVGYARDNLQTLLEELNSDLNNYQKQP